MTAGPRFPLFIPSKSRAEHATTPDVLDRMGVSYRLIVEAEQRDAYVARYGEHRVLTLPRSFQLDYETCDDYGASKSFGAGPVRNYAWQVAIDEGYDWHWVMDDNIQSFIRRVPGHQFLAGDGTMFAAMEEFVQRYRNVGMAGPSYDFTVPLGQDVPPFITGTRIFSCNLIRNSMVQRWRGRYNEDAILSVDILKAGWATVQFFAFLQKKMTTQKMPGGNTEAFYALESTAAKSAMLAREHPDVTSLVWRYGRPHHHIDFSRWSRQRLVRDPDWMPTGYRDRIEAAPGAPEPTGHLAAAIDALNRR